MTTPPAAPSVARLLDVLRQDPGRPRLTWYGTDGERIELSGHVLDNWVAKTANLLVEELDAGPGTTVRLDLPPHWRAVVWALATWRVGAHLVLDVTRPADIAITSRPETLARPDAPAPPPREVVAVSLPALARRWDGPLPSGAIDAAQAVMTYGDVLTYAPETDPRAPALTAVGPTVLHEGLVAHARTAAAPTTGPGPTPRALVEPGPDDLETVLLTALELYARDGSMVLTSPDVAVLLAADDERRDRIVTTERVTGPRGTPSGR